VKRKIAALTVMAVAGALTGCRGGDTQGAAPAAAPVTYQSCTASPSPGAATIETKLAWRSEVMDDGSVRATVGDIDAAPRAAGAVQVSDYRSPQAATECTQVTVVTVRGWWCVTTVSPVTEHGEIVVGGARPRARLDAAGFRTDCSAGAPRHRALYEFQRDSWSGYRPYAKRAYTPWTSARTQPGPAATAACPQGRVGTYDYRLAATLEFTRYPGLAGTPASGRPLRQDCGTGIS
jgi:hypothetical protein